MSRFTSFRGLWHRTAIYEPISSTSASELDMLVLWLQSSCGLYIDIRVPLGDSITPRELKKCKTFAGFITFDEGQSNLTWTRVIDFRPITGLDVGNIKVLNDSGTKIQEDGVLPGDDYREIWEIKSSPSQEQTLQSDSIYEFVAELSLKDPDSDTIRQGYFIIVGDWFAFTLSRTPGRVTDEELTRYFCSTEEESVKVGETSQPVEDVIRDHISAFGQIIAVTKDSPPTWCINHAIKECYEGKSLFDLKEILSLLTSCQWKRKYGSAPSALLAAGVCITE